MTVKPTNPKDLLGSNKIPLHLFPSTAITYGAIALLDGALKYGRNNFRHTGVRATIYIDAITRHLHAWTEGEDLDVDSGVPHLAHILASAAILVEAIEKGNLEDDRNFPTEYREMMDRLTPYVQYLKEKHADKKPIHYTIQDSLEK
jgi:hypothetical protein